MDKSVWAKELKTSGTDDVCECWLVSMSANLFVRNVDSTGNSTQLDKYIQNPH